MKTLIFTILTFYSFLSFSQSWKKSWNIATTDNVIHQISESKSNDYLIFIDKSTNNDWLVRISKSGIPLDTTVIKIDTNLYCKYFAFYETEENFYFFGNGNSTAEFIFVKTDKTGDVLITQSYNIPSTGVQSLNKVIFTSDSNFVFVGRTSSSFTSDVSVIKADKNGNLIWTKNFGGASLDVANSLYETVSKDLIIVGYTYSFPGSCNVYILKLNNLGVLTWEKVYGGIEYDTGNSISYIGNDNYLIGGYSEKNNAYGFYQLKINLNGDTIQTKRIDSEYNQYCYRMFTAKDSSVVMWGGVYNSTDYRQNAKVIKTDFSGNTIWEKSVNSIGLHSYFFHDAINDNNDYYVGLILDSLSEVTIYRFRAEGKFEGNIISGKAFVGILNNCTPNTESLPIQNHLIKFNPGGLYTMTDSLGNYEMLLDSGQYEVSLVKNNSLFDVSCPIGQVHNLSLNKNDTIPDINFSVVQTNCHQLKVDITHVWYLRRCNPASNYIVNYSNIGTLNAKNVFIEVEFPNEINVISSTFPWSSQIGNKFTFNIGDVGVYEEGKIFIKYKVSCYAEIGQTLCVKAQIYPDSLCTTPSPEWDKSSVKVDGICNGDSLICFKIENVGENMLGASEFRVFANDTLIEKGTFQLITNGILEKCYVADGKTYRLEADQRPFHPGNSRPRSIIEYCGITSNKSQGFVTTVAQDDDELDIEIDCYEVIGSYDPNDKIVTPKGITENKFIPKDTELEYLINFQNVGNDTAFTVVIRDTLSPNLDLETIDFGLTSHNCKVKLFPNRAIEWRFNPIFLTDSTTNEEESHGFVKYKIKVNSNLEKGTLIENKAAIYFDYNSPIITNTAWNKIYDTTLVMRVPIKENLIKNNLQIFPNPTTGNITISTENEIIESIEIYNSIGSKVEDIIVKNKSKNYNFNFQQNYKGLYFVKVKTKENIYFKKIILNR